MAKHYARKSMLASAKLNKALIELEDLKRAKVHENIGVLAEASQ